MKRRILFMVIGIMLGENAITQSMLKKGDYCLTGNGFGEYLVKQIVSSTYTEQMETTNLRLYLSAGKMLSDRWMGLASVSGLYRYYNRLNSIDMYSQKGIGAGIASRYYLVTHNALGIYLGVGIDRQWITTTTHSSFQFLGNSITHQNTNVARLGLGIQLKIAHDGAFNFTLDKVYREGYLPNMEINLGLSIFIRK